MAVSRLALSPTICWTNKSHPFIVRKNLVAFIKIVSKSNFLFTEQLCPLIYYQKFFNFAAKEEDNLRMYYYFSKMGTVESWLQKRNELIFSGQMANTVPNTWDIIPAAVRESNYNEFLPPSLRRLLFNDIQDTRVENWGWTRKTEKVSGVNSARDRGSINFW